MKYSHLISKLLYQPLVLTPAHAMSLCQTLEARLAAGAVMEGGGHRRAATVSGPIQEPDEESPVGDGEDTEIRTVGETCIIPVHGVLVAHPEDIAMSECGCDMETLSAMIEAAEMNSSIQRVVYEFRSPGGSVTKLPETAKKILNSRKQTVAFTDSECCSGALWLAAQCDQFYCTGSSRVGSVGVYTICLDLTEQLKQGGVKINAISFGKFKLLGAYWNELTPEERGILQAGVDKIGRQFHEAMESHRMVSAENFGSGLVYDGEDACEMGFCDAVVDGIEDVLEGMVE